MLSSSETFIIARPFYYLRKDECNTAVSLRFNRRERINRKSEIHCYEESIHCYEEELKLVGIKNAD